MDTEISVAALHSEISVTSSLEQSCTPNLRLEMFGVSLDYLILGRSGYNLAKRLDAEQLRSDIDELVVRLEQLKRVL